MTALLAAFAIALVAAATQAVTGFGFALVATPLLAMVTDPHAAIVATALTTLMVAVGTTARERGHVRWRIAGPMIAAGVVGMPVGLLVLRFASDRALDALIAVAVLGSTFVVWRGFRIGTGPVAAGGAGVLAGVLSTATSTNGPPLVAALRGMGLDPRTFRATIGAIFAVTGAIAIVGFGVTGQLSSDAIALAGVGAPAVLLGWLAGNWAFARIDPERFRRIVLYALVVTSVVTLARTVTG